MASSPPPDAPLAPEPAPEAAPASASTEPVLGAGHPKERPPRAFATSLVLLLATGMILLRHDLRPSTRAMVVGTHIILGVATASVGLTALLRAFRLRTREFPYGMGLVLVSGGLLLGFGASRSFAALVAAHALIAATYAVSQLVPRYLAYLGAPALGLLLLSMSYQRTREVAPTLELLPPTGPVDPDRGGGFASIDRLTPEDGLRFTELQRCSTCHPHVTDEHSRSAHRHASVTNPYYLASVRDLLERKGERAIELCAGCHDLGLLAHRKLVDGIRQGPGIVEGNAPGIDIGVPCLACHGVTEVRSQRGGGALALALPDDPVVVAEGLRHTLSFLVTYVDPRSHRDAMMPRDGRSSTRCGVCHQAALHEGINGLRHTRGQTDRDDHRASAFFPGAGASGRLPPDVGPRSCAACHMAPRGGGHMTAAANTALPAQRHDDVMLRQVSHFLTGPDGEGRPWALSWVRATSDAVLPLDDAIEAAAGERVELHLLVSNERVGHLFPAGTLDTHQLWLEVLVEGPGALRLVEGPTAPAEDVDGGPEPAHALGARVLDEAGHVVEDHRTSELHAALWRVALAPGEGHIVRFSFEAPTAGAYRPRARLRQRKFAARVARAVVGEDEIPVLTLGDTQTDPPLAAPLRLARYADAAGAVWDDERAERALAAANRIAPGDLEVRLAEARHLLDRRHQRKEAADLLATLEDPRARYLYARALVEGGNPEEGVRVLVEIARTHPEDPEVMRLSALALRRAGHPDQALHQLERLLARRPDDFEALQLALATAGEAGLPEAAAGFREAAERVRPSRETTAVANDRARRDPAAGREADRDHVHPLVPAAAPPPGP